MLYTHINTHNTTVTIIIISMVYRNGVGGGKIIEIRRLVCSKQIAAVARTYNYLIIRLEGYVYSVYNIYFRNCFFYGGGSGAIITNVDARIYVVRACS